MKTLVFDVYSWLTTHKEILEEIEKQIDLAIGGKSTGSFLVKLGNHEEVQQEPVKPYWIPLLQNNIDRVEKALGFKPSPTTEEEARNIYLAWMHATDYKDVLNVWDDMNQMARGRMTNDAETI
jgi:FMN phosphatase YigB (HAD superfamily)